MIDVKTYIHGIYPRSADLIQVSRDVIRKRRKESDYTIQYKKGSDGLLKLQQSLDFDYIEDGKLAWHDIFRPVVEATQGLEIGALTRWFDNNCFFRQPIYTGKLKLDETKLEKYFNKIPAKKWKVTLPSPFTFAKLVRNEKGIPFEKLNQEITAILAQLIKFLEKKGVTLIQFNEPYLPYYEASPQDIKLFKKSLLQLNEVKGKFLIAYHFYFGDAAPVISSIGKTNFIDIIGIDFYKTALTSLSKDFPYTLAAGIVDGRNSLLEDKNAIKQFLKEVSKTISSPEVYITNNSDLDLLPESIAREKVKLLGEIKNNSS